MARSSFSERNLINDQVTRAGSYDNTFSQLNSTSITGAIDEINLALRDELVGGVNYKGGYDPRTEDLELTPTLISGNVTTNANPGFVLRGNITSFTSQIAAGDGIIAGINGGYIVTEVINDTSLRIHRSTTFSGGGNLYKVPASEVIRKGDMYTVTVTADFFNVEVSKGDVLIAEVDLPLTSADWAIVEGNIETASNVKYDNTSTGLSAFNVQQAIDILHTYSGTQTVKVTNRTLSSNYTLNNNSSVYQHIIANSANKQVYLPNSPTDNLRFIIKNKDTSTSNFDVTGNNLSPGTITLTPGESFEAIFSSGEGWILI